MVSIKKKIRSAAKNITFKFYKTGQKLGVSIVPSHYYSPIPNIRELEHSKKIWAKRSNMPGIKIDIDEQAKKLKETCSPFLDEYKENKSYLEGTSKGFGPGYGPIEAQALHGVIRAYNPRRIIEVGSGVSTHCMLEAARLNKSKVSMTCIEPFPSKRLVMMDKEGKIKLLKKKVQEVPGDLFRELGENDLLFIDSSHAVRPAGDVNYLILEILPLLKKGVIVHFHDIFFPYDYQRSVLKTFFHWTETSLLHAFLIYNQKAEILFSLSMLHYDRKRVLKDLFSTYVPQKDKDGLAIDKIGDFPSSTYLLIK